jgi:hypothetical protein
MQAVPGAFDTKFLSLMTALRAAMARRVFAAAARRERDPLEPMMDALAVIEIKSAGVPAYRPGSLPVAHRYSA